MIDPGYFVDNHVLQLAPHLFDLADVDREYDILKLIEPKGTSRGLKTNLAELL